LENPWGFYEPTARLTWNDLCAYSFLTAADATGTAPASDGVGADQSTGTGTPMLTVNAGSGSLGSSYTSTQICDGAARKPVIVANSAGATIWLNGSSNTGSNTATWGGSGGAIGVMASDAADNGQPLFAPSSASAYGGQSSGTDNQGIAAYWRNGSVPQAEVGAFTAGTAIPRGTTGSISGQVVDSAILQFLESNDVAFNGNIRAAAQAFKLKLAS
jgi:hypothetical protein